MRKLLSVTCFASLLLVLPSLALSQTQQQTSWGMLKSRFGRPDTVERNEVFERTSEAITSIFNDSSVRYVLKIGLPEDGYVGLGLLGNQAVFVALVDGNFHCTKFVWLDEFT